MHPIYRFVLSIDGENALQALPVYKDDLAIDYEQESGQQFFRGKLNGKLTFNGSDFVRIVAASFDAEFGLEIFISYDMGKTWEPYWNGQFYKTDCEINEDDKTVIVTPTLKDRYNAVLSGIDKEYNLIDLQPIISRIKYDKRPMIQVYVPGETTIGCFLSGMWWEQECESVTDIEKLEYDYFFAFNVRKRIIDIQQGGTPKLPLSFIGEPWVQTPGSTTEYESGDYKFTYSKNQTDQASTYTIVRKSDGVTLWSCQDLATYPREIVMQPVQGSGAIGNVTAFIHDVAVYARYLCDVLKAGTITTNELPTDDIVENNRNYTRVVGYEFPSTIIFSSAFSNEPTKWGLHSPGMYYVSPQDSEIGVGRCFPIARKTWGGFSVWFTPAVLDTVIEVNYRKESILKDAFPLWSVISVLLEKIAPGITHAGTEEYSQFLYAESNPLLSYIKQFLFITPKSNIIFSGYDQPAQKAPITLQNVLNMLRDCFRCYWFIDEQNRFRIEHISWFMRGGRYRGEPTPGINLTEQLVSRNGKPWSYARNKYKYEKPEMASRYQFGWMDDSTELFDGEPIDIISKYVNPENIEKISVSGFSSDIDYILLNPGEISKDGFVLLGAIKNVGVNNLPISASFQVQYDLPVSWTPGGYVQIKFSGRSASGQSSGFSLLFLDDDNNSLGTIFIGSLPPTIQEYLIGPALIPENATKLSFVVQRSVSITITDVDCGYKLPYTSFVSGGASFTLQNAYVAFVLLQLYYRYDMPAKTYQIGGTEFQAIGIKKLRTQEISFPVLREPNMFDLIKTELGNGAIQKMSVNLSSRNAKTTLKYDTE